MSHKDIDIPKNIMAFYYSRNMD